MNIVVAFGSFERPGVECNGVQLAGRGRNGQDGCEHIVRGVSLDCNLSVRDPMGQDRSGSEGLLKCIEGRTTLISKVPRNILACEVREQIPEQRFLSIRR